MLMVQPRVTAPVSVEQAMRVLAVALALFLGLALAPSLAIADVLPPPPLPAPPPAVGGTSGGAPLTWSQTRKVNDAPPYKLPVVVAQIDCASPNLCMGPGAQFGGGPTAGGAYVTTDPGAGPSAWKFTVPGHQMGSFADVSCPSTTWCIAAGGGAGQVSVSLNPGAANPTWGPDENVVAPAAASSSVFRSIDCPTTSMCAATDDHGRVFTSTTPTDEASWTTVSLGSYVSDVSCPTASLCVVAGSDHSLYVSDNPTGGAGAWHAVDLPLAPSTFAVSCASVSLCVALTWGGPISSSTNPTDPGSWTTVAHPLGAFAYPNTVSCGSPSMCVITDAGGEILSATNPTGPTSAWSVSTPFPLSYYDIHREASCPSANFCVTVDENGNALTSTNPTGGAAAWARTYVGGWNPVFDLSCPSETFCLAAGFAEVETSTGPESASNWTRTPLPGVARLLAADCVSTTFCVVAGDSGQAFASTDPTGGAGGWTQGALPTGTQGLVDLSCPTTSLCVGLDQSDADIVTTSHPNGGTW